jgi:hypothetical protein
VVSVREVKTVEDAAQILEELAARGICASIACGPSVEGTLYSVVAINSNMDRFEKACGARSIFHACEIVWAECQRLGWLS